MTRGKDKASHLQFEVRLEGAWKPFQADVEALLEREFSSGKGSAKMTMYGQEYLIDFRGLTQKNLKTGKLRPMRISAVSHSSDASHKMGRISFEVLEGRGLLNTEYCGNMDPYCRVTVGPDSQRTGTCKDGGSNPVWKDGNGKASPLHWVDEQILHVVVMDEDTGTMTEAFSSVDDFVGECHLFIPFLARQGTFEGWVPVFRNSTLAHGEIKIRVACEHILDMDHSKHVKQLLVAPCKMHRNRMHGIVNIVEEGSLSMFKTFVVALHGVADAFGDSWCCDYDKEHAVVFANTPQGMALRASFATQHASLFRESSYLPGQHVEAWPVMAQGDFLRLIKGGMRDGRRRVYTYVLLDDGIFFSETGMQVGKDTLSKHVVLANAAAKVRYAGTFRICMDESNEAVLVFDNDSGTYRPNGETAPLVERVLSSNIPSLRVKGLNVLKPQPVATKYFRGPNEVKGRPGAVYGGQWEWAPEIAPSNIVPLEV
mmetsp:Transcript_15806/g.37196  ORF Transcript_15806/g.37196 Transcript_15806/m.37196 type:complete len:484 (+) Transcript_15806:136-1587(+)|eukprot:CAMPEP_0178432792 /NCGR_PEP_ID=MMETSP0689_2-20121128/32574_1 /TAXON_ID=160604 /ORGANISM="Amphidinium massartii, Strain CS-259" /LENGTH=483 /DNA_ID=CAMNT_0020054803 /DNA_START=51 /DNA_END=1502 /DNA_ORIENTATION=-